MFLDYVIAENLKDVGIMTKESERLAGEVREQLHINHDPYCHAGSVYCFYCRSAEKFITQALDAHALKVADNLLEALRNKISKIDNTYLTPSNRVGLADVLVNDLKKIVLFIP